MTSDNKTQNSPDILFPDLPICDPHHHFFDNPEQHYLLKEFSKDIKSGHNIVRSVYIDCHSNYYDDGPEELKPVGETKFIIKLINGYVDSLPGIVSGIVGFADLTSGSGVAATLEAHLKTGQGRFKGVRQVLAWDKDPALSRGPNATRQALALDHQFREGFSYLKKYGLSFDAMVFHPQLGEVAELAGAFPETTIILNHAGVPLGTGLYAHKCEEIFRIWKQGMTHLAKYNNVFVKIGGFGMDVMGFEWNKRPANPNYSDYATIAKPYILFCIEKFGVARCMFESNYPVDGLFFSYKDIWNAFKLITKEFSADERKALFHDTAVNVYRLNNKPETLR